MLENLNFGKIGFNTCVLEKNFILYSCILFIIFNALRSFFKNQVIFFQKILFFQNFDWFNLFFDQLKLHLKFFVSFYLFRSIETDFRSIENRKSAFFFKIRSWLFQIIFFKSFSTFFSLSDSARLHKEFLVIFLQISCKVSLSLSRYVYFTLPFALFFSFSCIISWFLDKFSNYA